MKDVYSKPVHKMTDSDWDYPLGSANNATEASELEWDMRRRSQYRTPKAKDFVHAEHSSGRSGFFPKK